MIHQTKKLQFKKDNKLLRSLWKKNLVKWQHKKTKTGKSRKLQQNLNLLTTKLLQKWKNGDLTNLNKLRQLAQTNNLIHNKNKGKLQQKQRIFH